MKLDAKHRCVICEQCGSLGPSAETIQEAVRSAVEDCKWDYVWEHSALDDHIAHLYCSRCKSEFVNL